MMNTDQNISGSYPPPGAMDNATSMQAPQENQHYHLFRYISTYVIPITCLVGLVCNALATRTFLNRNLIKYSCSMYLISKSVSDSMFLLNLAVIYTCGIFQVDITGISSICHIVVFLTYISGFVSVWCMILVTIENFIRVRFPFDVKRLCTTRHAKFAMALIVVMSLCVYHFSLWVSNSNCGPKPEFEAVTQAFVLVDSLITLVLPSILLTGFIIAIISKLFTIHRGKQIQMRSVSTQTMVPSYTSKTNVRPLVGVGNRKSRRQLAAVTKMLLAVSLTYFFLTFPSHLVRIFYLLKMYIYGVELSPTDAAVQGIAQLIYYFSMATNLFIYILFGENFRRVFQTLFFKPKSGDTSLDSMDRETTINGKVASAENTLVNVERSADNFEDSQELEKISLTGTVFCNNDAIGESVITTHH